VILYSTLQKSPTNAPKRSLSPGGIKPDSITHAGALSFLPPPTPIIRLFSRSNGGVDRANASFAGIFKAFGTTNTAFVQTNGASIKTKATFIEIFGANASILVGKIRTLVAKV
jgi:hypothetical protein